ncbi:glycosyltransferase [Jannaschia formosa]|uniref:glycosyltransferase n=1 Tax=Jannaschia formosa TaxID=2259592 RepID=UPI00142F477A|nr:glycosyltransferase [Jannaschia formosa]
MSEADLYRLISESGYFDEKWYCSQYLDVKKTGIDPLEHYLRLGRILGRNPSPLFDSDFYVSEHEDHLGWQENPLVDYLTWGQEAGWKARPNQGRAALVVHVFHLDTLSDLAAYSANFPDDADQLVTCPDDFDAETLDLIAKALPRAQIVPVPNAGQDAGALIALARKIDLTCYDVICKIHSKKGAKEPARWRHALLRGVLGSRSQVDRILRAFETDPRLTLAGARQLYLHGPSNMRKNNENFGTLFGGMAGDFDYMTADWGFIAGTCFWIRSAALEEIRRALGPIEFQPSAYTDDGTIAHSIERGFGMVAALRGGRTLLSDVSDLERVEVVEAFPADGRREQVVVSQMLPNIAFPDALSRTWKPRGAVDESSRNQIGGWLAVIGDQTPREGILRIGKHEVPLTADHFRQDLKAHGINEGRHAFQVSVPLALYDGKSHEAVLIDKRTSTEIARRSFRWEKPKRDYWDFQGFLKSSMTQPEIHAPFAEEDKRAFAVMEGIAKRLAGRALSLEDKPLVSVVMPMFNRASIVGDAVTSVLAQSYGNFELIVVDDGSSDDSVAVVNGFYDPRIRLIELRENRGVTVARNTALKAARGEIIAYLDSDNTWDDRFLAAHVGALDELPDADMIYSGVLLYRSAVNEPHAIRYGHLHRALLENKNYIDNNIIVHRREFLDRLGGFDEKLRRYVDWDLVLRATEFGKIYSVPVLLCHYHYNRSLNAITDNVAYVGHLDILLESFRMRKRAYLEKLDQAELIRPVSVVIPNWQSLEDIHDCIEALARRDWKGMLDIIVVDNDSSEEVREYLRAEQDTGRILFIPLESNFGFTYAVNVGIEQARPDSDIVLLNNDAIAQPGAVQALQRACLDRPDAGMTVPRQILPAGTKTLRTHVPFASVISDCDVNISAHHRNVANVPIFHDGKDLEFSYAAFFAVYIRRELIDQIGPLDAEYGRHYRSDRVYSDMMRNLTDYRMYYVPDSHFIHKLQKATDHLRDIGEKDKKFELMFRRNQWDKETAEKLSYRFAPWDTF